MTKKDDEKNEDPIRPNGANRNHKRNMSFGCQVPRTENLNITKDNSRILKE